MRNPRQPVIAGVYLTRQARTLPGRGSQDLTLEAVKGALDDAGLSAREVDGVALDWSSPAGSPMDAAANWAPYFRQPLSWVNSDPFDRAGARAVAKAAAAIEFGLCDIAVIGSGRAGPWSADGSQVGAALDLEFTDPFGGSAMTHFALVMRRYMHDYGVPAEKLAAVAATIRNHGHVNPEAVMFGAGPYTAENILASPPIALPLHRLECCLVNEGGCALVMTTAERAADLRRKPIAVLAGGQEVMRGHYVVPPTEQEAHLGRTLFTRILGKAAITPRDIDYFSLYDAVAFETVRQFEMLGLCGPGEGADLCAGRALDREGAYPTNLDGGLLAFSWIGSGQLTNKVIDAVRQLRGECGDRQVPGAELALVTNAGSGAHHMEAVVLGR